PPSGSPAEDGSCTSSDNDIEGLRQRQGHKPHPGPPPATPAPHREAPDTVGEDGLSMSKYLLGALAMVAVGLLIITGEAGGVPSSPRAPNLPVPQDSQQKPTLPDAGDPQSMQSMSQILDKLAKENQEIRLMQAELQAHKEELRALLHRREGEGEAAGAQHEHSLAAENAWLRQALEREVSALRGAQAELRRLQAGAAPGSPGEPSAGQPRAAGALAHGEAAAHWHRE
ncbi:PBIP1 protein, partial [Scytalopus superciliaris]|nr:PBIP1 protein [Scytalopus superciliaris]